MPHTKQELIFFSRLAEQTERYQDMLKYIKQALQLDNTEPSVEERNLLNVAYKCLISVHRIPLGCISVLEEKEESKGAPYMSLIKDVKKKIEEEFEEIHYDAINFIDTKILKRCESVESKVFFLKMKADFYRNLIHQLTGEKKTKVVLEALKAYCEANEIATNGMKVTDPMRLRLGLSLSVFYYEIMNNCQMAYSLTKQLFDDAVNQLETLGEDEWKESTHVMQLLRDNLTLWSHDLEEENGSSL